MTVAADRSKSGHKSRRNRAGPDRVVVTGIGGGRYDVRDCHLPVRHDARRHARRGRAAAGHGTAGETLNGTDGRPCWELEATIGGHRGSFNLGTFSRLRGSTRIGSDLAASDWRFLRRTWILLYSRSIRVGARKLF